MLLGRDGELDVPEGALADGDRDAVLAAVPTELGGSRPTVLVLEDVRSADDATLDVLRYVGRRVDELAAVIVVTFRDGEVGRSLHARDGRGRLLRRINDSGHEGESPLSRRRVAISDMASTHRRCDGRPENPHSPSGKRRLAGYPRAPVAVRATNRNRSPR